MIIGFLTISLLMSLPFGASSSMVIKHTYQSMVHYIETGPKNYAFTGIVTPDSDIKSMSLNNDQLVVERTGCNRMEESWDKWRDYLSTMASYYSNINSAMFTTGSSGITNTIGSVGGVSGVSMFSYKQYSISVYRDSMQISAPDMPMSLVELMFIGDTVVSIYSDGRVEASTVSCISEEQRQYVQKLQEILADRGVKFDSAGSLIYDESQDKISAAKSALSDEKDTKVSELEAERDLQLGQLEANYENQLQQLENSKPTDWKTKRRELKDAMKNEKYRIKDAFRTKRNQIKEEYYQKKYQLNVQ